MCVACVLCAKKCVCCVRVACAKCVRACEVCVRDVCALCCVCACVLCVVLRVCVRGLRACVRVARALCSEYSGACVERVQCVRACAWRACEVCVWRACMACACGVQWRVRCVCNVRSEYSSACCVCVAVCVARVAVRSTCALWPHGRNMGATVSGVARCCGECVVLQWGWCVRVVCACGVCVRAWRPPGYRRATAGRGACRAVQASSGRAWAVCVGGVRGA